MALVRTVNDYHAPVMDGPMGPEHPLNRILVIPARPARVRPRFLIDLVVLGGALSIEFILRKSFPQRRTLRGAKPIMRTHHTRILPTSAIRDPPHRCINHGVNHGLILKRGLQNVSVIRSGAVHGNGHSRLARHAHGHICVCSTR